MQDKIGKSIKGGELGGIWNLAEINYQRYSDRSELVLEMEQNHTTSPYFRATQVNNEQNPFASEYKPTKVDISWGDTRIDISVSDLYSYNYPLQTKLPIIPTDDPVIVKIGTQIVYDDALMAFSIGLKYPVHYEVVTLKDPDRIVVKVYH